MHYKHALKLDDVVVVRDHTQIRVILRMVQTESRHTKVTNMANSNFRSNARQSLPKRSQPFFRMDHRLRQTDIHA